MLVYEKFMQESKSFYDLAISSTTPATLQDCGQPTLTNTWLAKPDIHTLCLETNYYLCMETTHWVYEIAFYDKK